MKCSSFLKKVKKKKKKLVGPRNLMTQVHLQRIQLFCEATSEKSWLQGRSQLDLLRNSGTKDLFNPAEKNSDIK